MNNKYKNILFLFFLFVLFIPLLQMKFNFVKLNDLKGEFTLTEKPDSIKTNWFSEKYQIQYDKYFNDHLGFRNILVRINNQIAYSFFNKVNAYGLTEGTNGYTYGEGYIMHSYQGTDFLGEKKIDNYVKKTKQLQDKLKKELNIDLIVIYAPSKEVIIPEFFPNRYKNLKYNKTNIEYFLKKSKKYNINYIDFNSFFRTLKDTSSIPVYYKHGEHWTYQTMCYATDSLVRYIENLRNIDMPNIKFKGVEKTTEPRFFDYDQADAMNLLFKIKDEEYYYPILSFNSKNKTKPKVLGVADCYYQQMYQSPIADSCFYKGGELWFYYRQSQSKTNGYKDLNLINKHNLIINQDVIIILHTNHTLNQFGYGFIDELEMLIDSDKYKKINEQDREKEILKIIERIKKNKDWYNKVKTQAKERNITVNEMLRKTAIYVIKNRNKEK